jgi:hypothetical protein
MSETQIDTPQTEMRSEVSTSDDDKALQAIWDKNNSPEALDKNPLMPDVPAGDDIFKAAYDWNQLPLKDRQMTSAVHREFADLKKQGEALGMKTETAADMKAIQDMLAGDKGKAAPPAIDKDTQASLDTFKAVVPFAKDHREASQFLNGWAETIARDPDKGWSELLKAQGMGHLLRDGTEPRGSVQQPAATEDSGVAAWAAKRGVSVEDQRAMGDKVSEPTWREIAGESLTSTLDRAHKAVQRDRARNGANNPTRRVNDDLDRTLRGIAADIARP